MGPAGGASEAQPRSGEMDASGPVRSDPALPVFLSGAARERDAARVRLVDRVGQVHRAARDGIPLAFGLEASPLWFIPGVGLPIRRPPSPESALRRCLWIHCTVQCSWIGKQ